MNRNPFEEPQATIGETIQFSAEDINLIEQEEMIPEETLLPQEPPAEIQPLQENMEPTVVKRPLKQKRTKWKITLRVLGVLGKWILAVALAVAILAGGLLGYLTVTEYNPAYAEDPKRGAINNTQALTGSKIRILTFNTGFGSLGEDADFFMDGGSSVNPESEEIVKENMLGIEEAIKALDADFLFLQEVDSDSDRSFNLNQWLQYEHDFEGYESRFALNYSCDYVPYPLTETIGKVNSGIATYSRYDITAATRFSLPCPFTWPVRIANLKRCLLLTRIPIEGKEEQELVLINCHMDAYDDGEGKLEQTKQLVELMQQEYAKGNYVIVGGDFNQSFPFAEDYYPIAEDANWKPGVLEELPDGWQYAYDNTAPTSRLLDQPYDPMTTQHYVIDGFILSPNVRLDLVQTVDEGFVYSDHNPVMVEVTLQ